MYISPCDLYIIETLCNVLLFIYNIIIIISLFTERVQGYTSPALFKADIIADCICVLNLKTNRRRLTNKVSNPMFSRSRNTLK